MAAMRIRHNSIINKQAIAHIQKIAAESGYVFDESGGIEANAGIGIPSDPTELAAVPGTGRYDMAEIAATLGSYGLSLRIQHLARTTPTRKTGSKTQEDGADVFAWPGIRNDNVCLSGG